MSAKSETTLIAVGDVNLQSADPADLFGPTAPLLGRADIVVGNQEGVVAANGSPLLGKREVGSSCVRGLAEAVPHLAKVGFSAMSLANNHAMDYGAEALLSSLELFHENGILVAGAGSCLDEAHRPALIERSGTRVAMLAYTSVFPPFGFAAGADSAGVAVIRVHTAYETPPNVPYQPGTPPTIITIPDGSDAAIMESDVRAAKEAADVVVVQFHWGVVGVAHPSGYMKELGRRAIDAGATLVIGNHPHVMQGLELYGEGLISYSLNHFAFEHAGHPFPSWPFVHQTLMLEAKTCGGRLGDYRLHVCSLDPQTHALGLAGADERAEVATHLTALSAEFQTDVTLDGEQLVLSRTGSETRSVERAPEVYYELSSVVRDARRVVAQAASADVGRRGSPGKE